HHREGRRKTEGRRGSRIDADEGGPISLPPLGTLRDPHEQHPCYPRGGSADTGRNPSRVSLHLLTAVSTEPGQNHPPEVTHSASGSRPRASDRAPARGPSATRPCTDALLSPAITGDSSTTG